MTKPSEIGIELPAEPGLKERSLTTMEERLFRLWDGQLIQNGARLSSRFVRQLCREAVECLAPAVEGAAKELPQPRCSQPAPDGELPRVGTGGWHEHPCDRDVPDGECSTSEMLRRCANLIEKCAVPADFNVPEWTAALRSRAEIIEPKFRQHAAQPVSPAAPQGDVPSNHCKACGLYYEGNPIEDECPACDKNEQIATLERENTALQHRLDLLGDAPSPTEDTLFGLSSHHTWHHNEQTRLEAEVAKLKSELDAAREQLAVAEKKLSAAGVCGECGVVGGHSCYCEKGGY